MKFILRDPNSLQEIESKFAWLYRRKNRDRDFTSRDQELWEIEVRVIESYLYKFSDIGAYILKNYILLWSIGISFQFSVCINYFIVLYNRLKKIPGIHVFGDPLMSVVGFGPAEGFKYNIFTFSDMIAKRGWNLNPLQFPSRSFALTP
jgi:hypothetical protein